MIPCKEVVGIDVEAGIAHTDMLDQLLRECIAQLDVLQTDE